MQLKHDPPAEHPTSINAPTKTTATATAATILFPLIRQILSPRPRRVPRPRVRGRFSSHLQTALYAKPRPLSIAPANLFIHRRHPFIPPTKRGRPPVSPPIKIAKKPKHVVRRPLLNLCCRDKRGVMEKPRSHERRRLANHITWSEKPFVRPHISAERKCTRFLNEDCFTVCGRACERG